MGWPYFRGSQGTTIGDWSLQRIFSIILVKYWKFFGGYSLHWVKVWNLTHGAVEQAEEPGHGGCAGDGQVGSFCDNLIRFWLKWNYGYGRWIHWIHEKNKRNEVTCIHFIWVTPSNESWPFSHLCYALRRCSMLRLCCNNKPTLPVFPLWLTCG